MRPRKLILENVGPFVGKATIDFAELGDIFLICGRTGSGKTTIFDALCYALYGTLPGGRKGQTRRLRSDFADESADCSVSLEFELGDRAYLVERKPPRSRPKARGEGMIEDPETALLFELRGGRLEARSGKKNEADEKIKELIGLSFDEFSKIVILPQGEFAEFLKQSTSDRREVLRKLFPVDYAVRIREAASERAKTAAARLAEAERALETAAARFDADAYEESRAGAAEKAARALARAKALEAERDRLADELKSAEAELKTRERLEGAKRAEEALDARAQEFAAMEEALRLCRLARPLAPLLARAREAAGAAESAEEAAAAAETAAAAAAGKLRTVEDGRARAREAEREAAELREKRGPLEEAAKGEAESAALSEELSRLALRAQAAEASLAASREAARSRTAEIEALREKADSAESWDAAWEAARDAMERAKAIKPLAERTERIEAERTEAAAALASLEAELESRRAQEPVLKAELEEIESLIEKAGRAGSAAELAARLETGLPCPVCGSLDHPRPAAAVSGAFDLAARRDVRRRALEDGTRAAAAAEASARAARLRLSRAEAEAAEIARGLTDRGASLPSAAEAEREVAEKAAAANAAVAPRAEARRARDRIAALYREAERQEAADKSAAAGLTALVARRAALEAGLADRESRRVRALEAIGETGSAAAALAAADRSLAVLDAESAAWKEERERAGNAAAATAAAAAAARDAENSARAAAEAAREAFGAALSRAPFADEAALEAAILPPEEEARMERELPQWKEARNRARALREELETAVAAAGSGVEPDAEGIARALEENGAAREEAAREREAAGATLGELEREKRAYEEAAARRAELAERNRLLKALSDDLSGNNPRKRSFDAWLLGAYLSEVAAYATKRLERMSEGRYRLLLDGEREGGRGQTGLDLAVFDSYTGRARPCATLSGGESFMASISLALGLADSIQARSGGVRLDAVFIDEGFGSLDDASLDKALTILDEIRDHRMVGLISHVGEMRTRIPSRLEIVKTSVGSRVRVESGV